MPTIGDIRRDIRRKNKLWHSIFPPMLGPGEVEECDEDAEIRAAWKTWYQSRLVFRMLRCDLESKTRAFAKEFAKELGREYNTTDEESLQRTLEVYMKDNGLDDKALATIEIPEEVAELLDSKVWVKNPPMPAVRRKEIADRAGPSSSPGSTPRAVGAPGAGGSGSSGAAPAKAAPRSESEWRWSSEWCAACFQERPLVTALPCKHVCMCDACARKEACPMCDDLHPEA